MDVGHWPMYNLYCMVREENWTLISIIGIGIPLILIYWKIWQLPNHRHPEYASLQLNHLGLWRYLSLSNHYQFKLWVTPLSFSNYLNVLLDLLIIHIPNTGLFLQIHLEPISGAESQLEIKWLERPDPLLLFLPSSFHKYCYFPPK